MWKLVVVFSLLATISVKGQIVQFGQCNENINLQNDFDIERFADTWYVIRSTETSWTGDCASFEFQNFDTGAIAVTHNTVRQNFQQTAPGTGTLAPNTARLSLTIPQLSNTDIDFWVIDTDYDTYALTYGCQNVGNVQRNVYIWQLSRNTTFVHHLTSPLLNQTIWETVGLTNADLRDTRHDEDGCFILPIIQPGESIIIPGQCNQDITGVANFSVTDFLGVWHQIASYHSENANGTCNRAQYSDGGDVVNVVNSQVLDQELLTISGSATLIGTSGNGHLNVTLEILPGVFVDSELKVLGTDYVNWAISYTCVDIGPDSRQLFSWILSRTRVLPQQAQDEVNLVISSYIELNDQYYQTTDQSQTGCFYVPAPVLNQPVIFGGQCDQNIAVVTDFNAARYLGIWHDIESYPTPFQGGACATAEYSLGDGVVDVYNTQVINQRLDDIYGTAVQVGTDGKLVVTFPIAGTNETTNTDYWVIATDYESYSLVYSCTNINDYQQQVTVWKLSRSKSLTNQTNTEINDAMSGVPVIYQQFFEETDQSPEGCYYIPEPTGEVVRFPGQCEDLPVVEDFDFTRFNGEWVEVQAYPKDDQPGQCVNHQFAATGNGMAISTWSVADQLMVQTQGQLTRINATSTAAAFELSIQGQNPVSFPYYIIATDYDNYALAYSCVEDGDYFKKIYAWKLSRTNELSAQYEEAIANATADIDVIREELFEPILHTEYACYFFPPNLSAGDPVILEGQCSEDVPVMQNFDAGRYLGRWRLIESYSSDNQLGTCNQAYYELNGTDVIVQNSEVRNQTLAQDIGIATLENATVGQLSVTFPGALEPTQLYVLDTDYDTYSLVYACININTNTFRVFSWKMSRTTSLIPEAVNAIATTVDTIKVLNNRYYELNDHSDDGCFYFPSPGAPIVIFPGQCDETIPVVTDFNVTAYLNLWHDVGSYPLPFQDGDCPNAFYSLGDDGVDVYNTQVIDQSLDTIRGVAVLANETSGEAKLLVNFPSIGNFSSNYWVLATDYEDYALVYACQNLDEERRQVSSWKLSRSKTLSGAAVSAMNDIINTIPVLDDRYYIERDQSPEGCFYFPEPETGKPVEFPGECDLNITVVQNFDLQRFEGVWHEIEAYPKEQQQGNCIRHEFTVQPPTNTSFGLQSFNVIAESLGIIDGVVSFSSNDNSARFTITFTSNSTSYTIPYWIIDTDYDNYALAYSCVNRDDIDYRGVFSWKLSRTKELPPTYAQRIEDAMANVDVIDQRYFEPIDQNEDACFYLPDLAPGEPVVFPGRCDANITVVPNFDAARYLGTWKLVEHYPSDFQLGTCGEAEYSLGNSDEVIVRNTEVINETLSVDIGVAQIIDNGKLLVQFPDAPFPVELWVLDTDYDTFSIVYSCIDIDWDQRRVFSWKLSRTGSLNTTAIDAINAVLDRVNVLDQRYYVEVDRTPTGCFYYPVPDGNPVRFRAQCDDSIPVVTGFDVEAYGGLWYDLASYPIQDQNGECPNAYYTLGENGVDVFNTQVVNQTLDTIRGLAILANASSDEAKLLVNFPSVGPFFSNYWVLSTDYTSYAFVYSCFNINDEYMQVFSWKLSRTKELTTNATTEINSIIDSIPVLRNQYYLERDQTDDGCFYFPEVETGRPVMFPGRCDGNATVVQNFDLNRFEGVWHEIEAYPKEQQQGNCIRHEFTVQPPTNTSFGLQSFNVIAESLGIIDGVVSFSSNDNSARFTITFTSNSTSYTIPYWIIDTDYDNYALAYSCVNRDDIDYRGVFSWKLSRTKELPPTYAQRIEDAMANVDVIDQRYFEPIDQNEDACFYLPDLAPGEPVVFPGRCDANITVVPNFDAARYLGTWKLVEHYPSDFQLGTCGEAEYSLGNSDEVIVRNTEVINETLSVDIGVAQIIDNGKLLVQFPDAPFPVELWVLDTDYDTFSIVYSCIDIDWDQRRVFSWKLSRTGSLNTTAIDTINAVLDRVNVLDQRYYVEVDRTPTGCFYYPVPDGNPVRFRAQCDESIPVVTGFDVEAYGGLWYDLASYPIQDQNGECPNAYYTLGENGVDVFNTQVVNQTLDTIRGLAILANASSDEAKLLVNFPSVGPFFSNYWVLSTDYTSYAFVYSCFNINDEYMQVFSWKLSRTKELTTNATTEINSIIDSIPVLRNQYYLERDQTDDGCFYFPEVETGRPVMFPGRCDGNATVVQNFDLNRFQGRWRELETYPKEQQTGECISHEFTVTGNSFELQSSSVLNEFVDVTSGNVTFTSNDNSARFVITIQGNDSIIEIPYWIVDTDYDNYALAYSCVDVVDDRGVDMRAVYSWKLSRARELSPNSIQAINNAMSNNEVLENRYFITVDHTDDGCFTQPNLAPGEPVIFDGQCDPNLQVVPNFDASRYLGTWNLIETYPSEFQVGTCADATYSPATTGTSVVVYNTEVVNQTLSTMTGSAVVIGNGKLSVTFPDSQPIEYWIMDTDYDSYSLVYSCVNINPEQRRVYSWKLSKTQSLTSNAVAAIGAVLSRVNVLNQRYYVPVDRTDEGCFYYPEPSDNPTVFRGSCDPNVAVVPNFDAERYLGTWNLIENYPSAFQLGTCADATYSLASNGSVTVVNTEVRNQTLAVDIGTAVVIGNAKLEVTFPDAPAPIEYWVLDTDYDSYSVVYSCVNLENNRRSVFSWKLSRTNIIENTAVAAVNAVLDRVQVLDQRYYQSVDRTDDGCFYYPEPTGSPVLLRGQCDDNIPVVMDFDVAMYEGTWYQIERYPQIYENANSNCVGARYTFDEEAGVVNLINWEVIDDELQFLEGTATLASDDGSAKLEVVLPVVGTNDTQTTSLYVLATDYETYSLAYSCSNLEGNRRSIGVWKLSRSRSLTDEANAAINTIIAARPELRQDYFISVEQNDECPEPSSGALIKSSIIVVLLCFLLQNFM